MQFIKKAVAAALLLSTAMAVSGPASAQLADSYGAEGSSVTLLAYNNSNSYLMDLGVTFDSLLADIGGLSPGGSVSYVLPSLGATFGLPTSGAYGAGVSWGVMAGNSNVFEAISTAVGSIGSDTSIGSITDSAIGTFYGRTNVGCPAGSEPCVAGVTADHWGGEPATSLDVTYFGANMLDQVTFAFAAANLSSPLALYHLTSTEFGDTASTLLANASVFYNAALGNWVAQFSVDGTAPVPLPAAVWLLLSGLAGMGAVTRRKRA